jgi:thiol-disulfide isomerase/thioredoxin
MGTDDNSGSGGNSLWIFALSALIGFAAVYVTMGLHDNAAKPVAGVEKAAQPPTAGQPDKQAVVKTGVMAAFVAKKTPEALPEISFKDPSGKNVTLADFKGRTVLLNLWATWCSPCREEMPSLDRLQQALGSDKFEVVALSLDKQGAAASQKFLDDVKAKALKLYVDASAKSGIDLKLIGMPTTLLINKDGLEVGRLAGPAEWDSEEAKKLIAAAAQ